MKQILLSITIVFFGMVASAQRSEQSFVAQIKGMTDKALALGNQTLKGLRSEDRIFYDSIHWDGINEDTGEFERIAGFGYAIKRVNGALRVDSIYFDVDFSGSPLPINGLEAKVRYDDQGRYRGYVIEAVTFFGRLEAVNFIIDYNDRGSIVLIKEIPNPLLGEPISGDSVAYVYDAAGFIREWSKFALEGPAQPTAPYEQYTDLVYNDSRRLTGYVHTQYFEEFTDRKRYSNVEFYNYRGDLAEAYLRDAFDPQYDFVDVRFDPVNDLVRLQIANSIEEEFEDEWIPLTTTTYQISGDTLTLFTDIEDIYTQLDQMIFEGGKLIMNTLLIDVKVGPVIPESRVVYEYDAQGNLTRQANQEIDFGQWFDTFVQLLEREYDDEGRNTQITYSFQDDDAIIPISRFYLYPHTPEPANSTRQQTLFEGLVKVFPNPVVDNCTLTIEGHQKGDGQIMLLDMQGKVVVSQKIDLRTEKVVQNLNFNEIVSGNYLLVIVQGNQAKSLTITKQ
jgi:hypothetical protein